MENKNTTDSKINILFNLCPLLRVFLYLPETKQIIRKNIDHIEDIVKAMHSLESQYRRKSVEAVYSKIGKQKTLRLLNFILDVVPKHISYNVKESIEYIETHKNDAK